MLGNMRFISSSAAQMRLWDVVDKLSVAIGEGLVGWLGGWLVTVCWKVTYSLKCVRCLLLNFFLKVF